MHVRRVRYASAPRRDARLPWHHGGRAPGARAAGARSPASGARFGAPPARRWPRAPTWSTRTGGCRPGSPRRPTSRSCSPRTAPTRRCFARSRLARRLARPVFARARVVTAVSRELAGWVQNATGRHIAAAHVHPMPVDSRTWPWTTGGGGTVVVARLTAQKRISLAIETTAFLASCGHDLPLTIVGDGPERERARAPGRAPRHRAVRPLRRRRRRRPR